MDAVQRVLEELTAPEQETVVDTTDQMARLKRLRKELLSNLVFESFWSCGDLAFLGGFNSVFERDACDDFGEVVKAA